MNEDSIIAAFAILECEHGCSPDEVKASYRQLVKVWHPDRFQGDDKLKIKATEKMKAINDAYRLLESLFEEVERLNRLDEQQINSKKPDRPEDTPQPAQPKYKEPEYKVGSEKTVITEKYDSKTGQIFFKKVVERTVKFDGRWVTTEKSILQTKAVSQGENFEHAAKQSMSFSLPPQQGIPNKYWQGTLESVRPTNSEGETEPLSENETESGHNSVFSDGSSVEVHRIHTDTWFHDDEKKASNGRKSSKLAALQEAHTVYRQRGDWHACFEVTQRAVELHREETWGWLKRSEALHRAGLEEEAYRVLIPAADLFMKRAEIPYRLACYSARLGDSHSAKSWLQRTFDVAALDGPYSSLFERYQQMAQTESDLASLRNHIPKKPFTWTLRKYFGV